MVDLLDIRPGEELADGRILGVDTIGLDARDPDHFWTRALPVLDESNRIVRGGMWVPQRSWWELESFVKLFIGGYGSGKSFNLCKRAIALALANAPIPVMIVSPTYRMARDTIVETLVGLLDGRCAFDRRLRYHWHKTTFDFTLVYKGKRTARIMVRNGENPARLKGSNIAAGLLDEPFLMDVAVFEQVVARIRHPQAVRLELALGGTPEQLNWGYDLAEGELRDRYDVGLVRMATKDNLALPPEYHERLAAGYSDAMKAAFLRGEFVNLGEGLVYHAFDPTKNLVEDPSPPAGAEPFVGMDFNVDPLAFCLGYRVGDRLHIHDERELSNADTFDACAEIHKAWKGCRIVYPDPTGRQRRTSSRTGSDFAIIREQGFDLRAPSAPWARRDRFASVNKLLREGRLTVGPKCRKLRRALAQMTYAIEHKEEGRKLSHLLDAMGYACVMQFPVSGKPKHVEFLA